MNELSHKKNKTLSRGKVTGGAISAVEFDTKNLTLREKRKKYGQFFTPDLVSDLAVYLAGVKQGQVVIDPMCGSGSMLVAASKVEGTKGVGIEIDNSLANQTQNLLGSNWKIFNGDSFAVVAGLEKEKRKDFYKKFDVVLGNPPYIRYQNISDLFLEHNRHLIEKITTSFPKISNSKAVDLAIRASLLKLQSGKSLEYSLGLLKSKTSITKEGFDGLWENLVKDYSGLSDLSLPAWLMTWCLVRDGGKIAYVTSASWKNRQYSKELRFFMTKYLRPLYVIEQDGGWFDDAQVPTSLMIFEARTPDDVVKYAKRNDGSEFFKYIKFKRGFNLSNLKGLEGAPFDSTICSLGKYIEDLIPREVENDVLSLRTETVDYFFDQQGGHQSVALGDKVGMKRYDTLPSRLRDVFVELGIKYDQFTSLSSLGVVVNQGMRTGFNPFFYLEKSAISQDGELVTVLLNKKLGGGSIEIPAKWLMPAIQRQKDVTGLCVSNLRNINGFLLVIPHHENKDIADYPGLRSYIQSVEDLEVRSNGKMVKVPNLSAVSPNIKLVGGEAVREWFNIRVTPRHTAKIFISRINHGNINTYINLLRERVIVDANFSTLSIGGDSINEMALYGFLNSSWVTAFLESSATPMGGGALKVEAAHLRSILVPRLSHSHWSDIERIARKICSAEIHANYRKDLIGEIDRIIFSAIGSEKSSILLQKIDEIIHRLRNSRNLKSE